MLCEFLAYVDDASSDKQSLPKKFADLLGDRKPRALKLLEVGHRHSTTWDIDVWLDSAGRMFLKRGWECFARTYKLQRGFILICSYDGRNVITVKMFDLSSCRLQYNAAFKGSVKMELADFEFYSLVPDATSDKLVLPKKFVELLKGREPHQLKLREADDPSSKNWDMDVLFDAAGRIFLGRGWDQFAQYYFLQRGSFLLFSYDGDALLTVKVFKFDMCRRHYLYDHVDTTSNETDPDPGTDEESTDEESTDQQSMDEDDPFDSSIIFS